MNPRELLLGSFQAALAAADPLAIVPAHLPAPPPGRTLVVGAGKAAAAMAAAVEAHWPADSPLDGLVITRYGHGLPTKRIRVIEAGHPVPDAAGEKAAQEILDRASALDAGRPAAGAGLGRRLEPAVAARRRHRDGRPEGSSRGSCSPAARRSRT